jgi:hypothetical protein
MLFGIIRAWGVWLRPRQCTSIVIIDSLSFKMQHFDLNVRLRHSYESGAVSLLAYRYLT